MTAIIGLVFNALFSSFLPLILQLILGLFGGDTLAVL